MAKFISGEDLEQVITDIIWNAEQTLMIVCPYIKLDDYFKKLFENHKNHYKIHLLVVFGKNENSVSKSLSRSDFDFFKNFLNVSIVYIPNLHAKFYANEKQGVITSINLYEHSFKHNIEFGVVSESLPLSFRNSVDQDAWNQCMEIALGSEAVYIKRPVYEKKLFNTMKNYVKSDVLHDVTDDFYKFSLIKSAKKGKVLSEFPEEIELGAGPTTKPTRSDVENEATGFCIRTGNKIPFNPQRPLCNEAYKSWAKYGNVDFPENFCHKTGKPSNGKTSMRNPILYKN